MSEIKFNIPYNPTKPNHVKFVNLTGKIFNRLTVLAFYGRKNLHRIWLCQCVCKKVILAYGTNLTRAHTKSCGCLNAETTPNLKHGANRKGKTTSEYICYRNAKLRCRNPKDANYHNYGGRGIEFRFQNFQEFIAHVGFKPTAKHSLDRIDVNGHYEKGNLRWATAQTQHRNRTNNRMITMGGVTQCVVEWAETYKIKGSIVTARLRRGWCNECAILLPVNSVCSHKT
jgi:hypothetical protein